MTKRYVSFLIVPEGNPKSLKFKLSLPAIRIILGGLGILVLFVVVLSVLHGRLLCQMIAGKSLKQENERLKRYNARVVELEQELQEYKGFVARVAELAGVQFQQEADVQLAHYTEDVGLEDAELLSLAGQTEADVPLVVDSAAFESDSLRHVPLGAPIEGWITQEFAMNLPGFGGNHPGIDFAAKTGTEVRATADGAVILAEWHETYGNLVAVDHGKGFVTYYGHNSKNLVNVGDAVSRGQVIALSGNTGRSSAPHLHYEIRKDDIPVDPESFLSRR